MSRRKEGQYVNGVRCVTGRGGVKRYYLRFIDVDNKRRNVAAKGCRTDLEAHAKLAEILQRVKDGKPGIAVPTQEERAQGEITVRELAELFRDKYVGPKVHDLNAYRRGAWSVLSCHVLPVLGDRAAASVRKLDVENLRDAMKEARKSERTIQKTIVQLSCMYRWGIDKEHIACANPARGVEKPTPPVSTDVYTDAEITKLFTWAAEHNERLYDLLTYAYYTGCRIGEIAAVRWEDVDLDGQKLFIKRSWQKTRKNGKEVVVPIHPRLLIVLQNRVAGGVQLGDTVFTTSTGAMLPRFRSWGIDKAVAGTGVRRFAHPWHALRHAHGTTLALNGAGLVEIRDALGHSSTVIAQRYVNIAVEQRRKYNAAMPSLGPEPKRSNVVNLGEKRPQRDKNRDKLDYADSEVGGNS